MRKALFSIGIEKGPIIILQKAVYEGLPFPDKDEAGSKSAQKTAELCLNAGATHISIVKLAEEFPESWDIGVDLPPGQTVEKLEKLIKDAPAYCPKPKWIVKPSLVMLLLSFMTLLASLLI